MSQVETSVDSFVKEMSEVDELSEIKFRGLMTQVDKLRTRASGVVDRFGTLSECDVNVELFSQTVEAKLQSLETSSMLKLKEGASGSTGGYVGAHGGAPKTYEKVDLEKSKPLKFFGDICEYPEFKRRFESIVGKANLPEEAFLDKLRDSIPKDA